MLRAWHRGGAAVATAIACLSNLSCIDSYDGSKIALLLRGGVHVPSDDDPGFGKPPSDTHYEMYVVKDNQVFHLINFEIRTVVDRQNPCYVEDEEARFPGLHSTMIAEKYIDFSTDPESDAGATQTDLEAGDVALAEKRLSDIVALERSVRVVVAHEDGLTDAAIATELAAVEAAEPRTEIDDASNANRLRLCRELLAGHPLVYVGNDKVFTLPINGKLYGMVDGSDPRNNAFVGGAMFDADAVFHDFDALRINWNFNAGCPADSRCTAYSPSNIGWHYMAGTPVSRTREVINVPMSHDIYPQIAGEAAIFPDVDDDDVAF